MKEWKYFEGSLADFIGAPSWAMVKVKDDFGSYWLEKFEIGSKAREIAPPQEEFNVRFIRPECKLIAQRTESFGNAIDLEFCKANPDHPDCKCKEQPSKYNRPCKGITLDIYDVLQAFAVTNPATQHAIKKLLCAGLRGHKDKMQDLTEALKSIERAIELEKE